MITMMKMVKVAVIMIMIKNISLRNCYDDYENDLGELEMQKTIETKMMMITMINEHYVDDDEE